MDLSMILELLMYPLLVIHSPALHDMPLSDALRAAAGRVMQDAAVQTEPGQGGDSFSESIIPR